MVDRVRRVSTWRWDGGSEVIQLSEVSQPEGFCWFELTCGPEETDGVLAAIGAHCPGLTEEMLSDLLTPDDQPEGASYDGDIRLASSFSVAPWRPTEHAERGRPQGVGVL